jgi:capsular polysaccharide biosynthesis protein
MAYVRPPEYTANVVMYVFAHTGDSPEGAYHAQELAVERAKSYVPLVNSPRVVDQVRQRLELPDQPADLASRIEATGPLNTVLLNISVTDQSPVRAARIADKVSDVFVQLVEEMEAPTRLNAMQHTAVQVIQPAAVPPAPSSMGLPIQLGLGLLAGLAVGACIVIAAQRHGSAPTGPDLWESFSNGSHSQSLPPALRHRSDAVPRNTARKAKRANDDAGEHLGRPRIAGRHGTRRNSP